MTPSMLSLLTMSMVSDGQLIDLRLYSFFCFAMNSAVVFSANAMSAGLLLIVAVLLMWSLVSLNASDFDSESLCTEVLYLYKFGLWAGDGPPGLETIYLW